MKDMNFSEAVETFRSNKKNFTTSWKGSSMKQNRQ